MCTKSLLLGIGIFLQISITFPAKSEDWSYFVFAQHWPPDACLEVPHGKCKIAKEVKEWTIHGLWPSSEKSYPSFCNNSWPFKPELLKPIVLALEAKWPNIYAQSSENAFWKHEWLKHGTCAASEKSFNSELKYFKKSLELHDKYNIFQFLRKAGITPSAKKPYMLKFIENAITLQINKTVMIFCKSHKDYPNPILDSMYICLSKQLDLIDCDGIPEKTCDKPYVFYLPFVYNKTYPFITRISDLNALDSGEQFSPHVRLI